MFLISSFHIHIARKTCNLGFKKSLYIIMNPIFVNLFYVLVSCYITSSCNITSVYFMEHIPGVKKNNHSRKIKFTAYNSGGTYV